MSVSEDGSADEKNGENKLADSGEEGRSFPGHRDSVSAPLVCAVMSGHVRRRESVGPVASGNAASPWRGLGGNEASLPSQWRMMGMKDRSGAVRHHTHQ